MSSTDSNPSTAAQAQTPDKLYTPFAVHIDESPDLLQRIDAATDTLSLVLDAGRQLTASFGNSGIGGGLASAYVGTDISTTLSIVLILCWLNLLQQLPASANGSCLNS